MPVIANCLCVYVCNRVNLVQLRDTLWHSAGSTIKQVSVSHSWHSTQQKTVNLWRTLNSGERDKALSRKDR